MNRTAVDAGEVRRLTRALGRAHELIADLRERVAYLERTVERLEARAEAPAPDDEEEEPG